MKWEYWLEIYLMKHCTACGLRASTIAAYDATLRGFRAYVKFRLDDRGPDELSARDILEYVEHLRSERHNGAHAVNRQVSPSSSSVRSSDPPGLGAALHGKPRPRGSTIHRALAAM